MESIILATKHAPPERSELEEVLEQTMLLAGVGQLEQLLNSFPDIYLILNDKRQIVFANRVTLKALGLDNMSDILGKRPGEALNCIHSDEMAAGCGTSEACRECGAIAAILNSQKGIEDIQECRISQQNTNDALDYRVWATPYLYDDQNFTIFAVQDISNEKRREVLERIFFHDILNTAGSLRGFAGLKGNTPEEDEQFQDILKGLTEKLIDEIMAQKEILSAENNELQPFPRQVDSMLIIESLAGQYRKHQIVADRKIELNKDAESVIFNIDEALLRRVIGNMLKNALEACDSDQTVTLNCFKKDNYVVFEVNNPSFMPRDIQLQVFQRSFSTKGAGRGLGTYSIKLLTERYLNGKVGFRTSEEQGTTFWAKYPI
jgi:signal transduction histidine kinase